MADSVKYFVAANDGRVFTYDGTTFSELTGTGVSAHLLCCWAVSPTDVWFGGASGTLIHYDGATFTDYTASSPVSSSIIGMFGLSSVEIYATTGDNPGKLLRWNGTAWAHLDTANRRLGAAIWGTSGNNLYMARQSLFITGMCQYTGGGFSYDSVLPANITPGGIWGVGSTIHFCWGGEAPVGLGSNWTRYGSLDSWTEDDDTVVNLQRADYQVGNHLWAAKTGEVWACFYSASGSSPNWHGLRKRDTDGNWSTVKQFSSLNPNHIHGVNSRSLMVVGQMGRCLYYDGSEYTEFQQAAVLIQNCVCGCYDGDGVKDALELHHATQRILFAKIDGIDAYLWQRKSLGYPTWTGRSNNHVCLRAPQNLTMELDLSEHWVGLDAMTFEFDDVKESDGTSYFGRLTATARWDVEDHWRVEHGTGGRTMIDADATTIPTKSQPVNMPDTAYIGIETFTYTGTDGDGFTGVSKGLYPAIGDGTWGYTYRRPREKIDPWTPPAVSEVPFSLNGRRIALYVTTYDREAKTWYTEGREKLLWAGRIADKIYFEPETMTWKLSCVSILKDFERPIFQNQTAHLEKINLWGDIGRTFAISEKLEDGSSSNGGSGYVRITVPKKLYQTPRDLANEINKQINETAWTRTSAAGALPQFRYKLNYDDTSGECSFEVWWGAAKPAAQVLKTIRLIPAPESSPCHALMALGFDVSKLAGNNPSVLLSAYENRELATKDDAVLAKNDPQKLCVDYHPMAKRYNGGYLWVTDNSRMWDDQGDWGWQRAWFSITEGLQSQTEKNAKIYYAMATAKGVDSFEIDDIKDRYYSPLSYIGRGQGDERIEVKQIHVPCYRNYYTGEVRGPFEAILFPMLSTGTAGYNHATYDVCPLECSAGIDSNLIDIDTFLDADRALRNTPLGSRSDLVTDWSGKSIKDLLTRECKLFGYAFCWDDEKFKLKRIAPPPIDEWITTIDEGSRAKSVERPPTELGADTVINQYRCNIRWDAVQQKFMKPIIITDVDSSKAFTDIKQIDIEHDGLPLTNQSDTEIKTLLENLLLGRYYRFPSPIVNPSLAPFMLTKLYVGDVVKYASSVTPDPLGSGTFASSSYALVIKKDWNYQTWTGSAVLMILSRYQNYGYPWAPSALIDKSYSTAPFSGGYDSTNYRLKLKARYYGIAGDDDDGAAFSSGDILNIFERCPADPTNPQKWASAEVASAYETDGDEILSLTAALTGFSSDREYIVTFADYDVVTTDQKSYGIWIADEATEKLGSVYGFRYG